MAKVRLVIGVVVVAPQLPVEVSCVTTKILVNMQYMVANSKNKTRNPDDFQDASAPLRSGNERLSLSHQLCTMVKPVHVLTYDDRDPSVGGKLGQLLDDRGVIICQIIGARLETGAISCASLLLLFFGSLGLHTISAHKLSTAFETYTDTHEWSWPVSSLVCSYHLMHSFCCS